jgi:DNA topoisomerase IB
LTTLRDGHVDVTAGRVRFSFRGKSAVEHDIELDDRRLARTVKACRDIPGYDLFQYYEEGKRQSVGSADVNMYLKEITGEDYTSKDFRTWAGTVLAAEMLRGFAAFRSDTEAKRNIVRAVESVAKRLGNTKAVCRKCYIHPASGDSGRLCRQFDVEDSRGPHATGGPAAWRTDRGRGYSAGVVTATVGESAPRPRELTGRRALPTRLEP